MRERLCSAADGSASLCLPSACLWQRRCLTYRQHPARCLNDGLRAGIKALSLPAIPQTALCGGMHSRASQLQIVCRRPAGATCRSSSSSTSAGCGCRWTQRARSICRYGWPAAGNTTVQRPRAALVLALRDPPSHCIPSGSQHKRSWGTGGGAACALALRCRSPRLAPAVCSPGCALALPARAPGWRLLCAVLPAPLRCRQEPRLVPAVCSLGSVRNWRHMPCSRPWCGQRRPVAAAPAPRQPPRSCRRAAAAFCEACLATRGHASVLDVYSHAWSWQVQLWTLLPPTVGALLTSPSCSAIRTYCRQPPVPSSCGRGRAASTSGQSP